MMNEKLVTIIGSEPLSLSLAAQYAERGRRVCYVDLAKNRLLKETKTLHVQGIWNTQVKLDDVVFSLEEMNPSETTVIAVSPSKFSQIFPAVLKNVRENDTVIFFPASFGAISFTEKLEERGLANKVTVAEAVSYPFVCAQKDSNTIISQSRKSELRIAVSPESKADSFISELNEVFDIFSAARNFLETSLDNMNMTIHPLPVLLNIGAIEKDVSFRHYIDGVTPTVGRLLDKIDAERMAVGEKLQVKLTSALDQLKKYYGDSNATNLFEYVSSESGPYTKVGRFGLDSRYVMEDIPNLLVPTTKIADKIGVEVPVMKLCVTLAETVLGVTF